MKKNIKTTLAGIFGATGMALSQYPDDKVKLVGTILTAVAVFALGYHAQDQK